MNKRKEEMDCKYKVHELEICKVGAMKGVRGEGWYRARRGEFSIHTMTQIQLKYVRNRKIVNQKLSGAVVDKSKKHSINACKNFEIN